MLTLTTFLPAVAFLPAKSRQAGAKEGITLTTFLTLTTLIT